MSTNRDYTIEELEAQYKLAEEKRNSLKQEIEQKKREEKELREAKLALEKGARKKELDEAFATYKKLLSEYMRDYGVYSWKSNDSAFDMFNAKFWNQII